MVYSPSVALQYILTKLGYRPELCHPFAPAIDSPLKEPVEMVCVKNNSKPDYVRN